MRCPDKAGRHEPYESRGSRADLWEPEAAMPPATRQKDKTTKTDGRSSARTGLGAGNLGLR